MQYIIAYRFRDRDLRRLSILWVLKLDSFERRLACVRANRIEHRKRVAGGVNVKSFHACIISPYGNSELR